MRPPWRLAGIRDTLRRQWRLRPLYDGTKYAPQFVLRPLEERRVLSVSPAVALALAAVSGESDVAQAVVSNPDPATPLGTDAVHQTEIDPGEQTAPDAPGNEIAEQADGEQPAAEDLTASDNASAESTNVETEVAPSAEADGLTLNLGLQTEPPLFEGSELAIAAEFTDSGEVQPELYDYTIDWGDGIQTGGTASLFEGVGSFDGTHRYADNGNYTITVTLSAGDRMVSDELRVTVENVTPALDPIDDQVIELGETLTLPGLGQFSDPGFDNPLNPVGEVEESFSFVIEWGDGTFDAGIPSYDPGEPGVNTAGEFDGEHLYAAAGVYTVRVTVSDDDGGTTFQEFTVTVNPGEPTLVLPDDQVTNEGDLFEFTADFTDPQAEAGQSYDYLVDWGDGTQSAGMTTLGEGQQGAFAESHHYADNGNYTVTVTLTTGERSFGDEFHVTVNNVTPQLDPINDQVIELGETLTVPGLGQFSDPGFDNPLNPVGEVEESFSFVIEWGDGTFDVGVPGYTPGSPGVNTAGAFDGEHLYAAAGVYTVRVTINDDDGGTTFQEFTVTVNPGQPILTLPEDQVTNEGDLVEFTAEFSDPQGEAGQSYDYLVDWGDGTQSAGMTTLGEGQQGAFTESHHYADNGNYTVTVTLTTGERSFGDEFHVTVNNVAPQLDPIADQIIDLGDELSLPGLGQFNDPGFDNPLNPVGEVEESFSFVIEWGDGTFDVGLPGYTPGSPGVATSGSFDGTHLYAAAGTYTVRVTINDDDGGTTFQEFTVTVRAGEIVLEVPEEQVLDEGDSFELDAEFTDPQGTPGDSYDYIIDWGDGFQTTGMTTLGPGQQGAFGETHVYADNGNYTVTVTLTSGERLAADTVQVTVNNVAPQLEEIPDQVIDEGDVLSLPDMGQFSDPGFDNPLNPVGEVEEIFSFFVDWGDGTFDVGIPTTDVFGSPGVPTSGTFDGTHLYATSGVYTVRVTISDDDGGTTFVEFTVTVRPALPELIVPGSQVINEGSNLSLPTIQFTDPHAGGAGSYSYTIDWGDGSQSSGVPVMSGGVDGQPAHGTFGGSHIYADNGIYTAVVTVFADNRATSAPIQVTVNNVAPSLTVVGNQIVPLGTALSLASLGQFNDPGFNNPLNPVGEVEETFSFVIEWGDAALDAGIPNINTLGGPGVATGGAFDGQHFFGAPGVYTVTATVSDDDGGTATATFTVTVFVIRDTSELPPGIIFAPGGAGGGTIPPRPEMPVVEIRVGVPPSISRLEYRRAATGSVAGAEPRLVLRVVTPEGVEVTTRDELLPDEILDNLRQLFKRLPDGHYRIYLIQPDGVEILVVDEFVHQGRNIDASDATEDAPRTAPPSEHAPQSDTAPQDEAAPLVPPPAPAPADAKQTLVPVDDGHDDDAALALVLGGVAVYARPLRRSRLSAARRPSDHPRIDKVRRLLRRLR